VRTIRGDFAVKVINPIVSTYAGIRENLWRSERIALRVAGAGLPAVAALEVHGNTVLDIGEMILLAYPWVHGEAVSSGSAGPKIGARIGGLIGQLHNLDLSWDGEQASSREEADEDWDLLVKLGEEGGMSWAVEVEASIPDFNDWGHLARAAKRELAGHLVVGHRDLDQKNVLWSDKGEPWMVDWESAGPIPPAKEIVTAALDWSGNGQDLETFAAILQAYRSCRELSALDVERGLHTYFDWLGWVAHNMRRSLGLAGESDQERALGAREVAATLKALRTFATNLSVLEAACKR